jgi:hypothetical protein
MLCKGALLYLNCPLQFPRYGVAAGGEALASSVTSAMEGVVVSLFLSLELYHRFNCHR